MNLAELPSFDFESFLKSSIREKNPHPIMDIPQQYEVFDLSEGYNPESINNFIESGGWAVGGFLERRDAMYNAPQYAEGRNIHMGIDIWARAGTPVFAALDGVIAYSAFHNEEGNYGGTLILQHTLDGQEIYVLYGHLSRASLQQHSEKDFCKRGEMVGWLGEESENGNWPPHLHLQVSIEDPGEADMPGVVNKKDLIRAREKYLNPNILLVEI